MGVAGEVVEHPSDLTKVPGRIIERRMVRVFSFRTFLTEECFEMVHYAEPGKSRGGVISLLKAIRRW